MKNEWVEKLKAKWSELSRQEQRTISIGATVLGLILLYLVIWSPMMARVDKARQQVVKLQRTFAWMKQADKRLQQTTPQPSVSAIVKLDTPAALLGFLQKQLHSAGLKESVTQLKQASQDAILLELKGVNFDRLVSFLQKNLKGQKIVIQQMSVKKLSSPGSVDAQIRLVIQP